MQIYYSKYFVKISVKTIKEWEKTEECEHKYPFCKFDVGDFLSENINVRFSNQKQDL